MTSEPFSCVVVGEEALLVECARLLLAHGHTVAAVVSPEPDLCAWAESEQLPALPLGRDLVEQLRPLEFDYLFSIANLKMLPDEVLTLPRRLPVNFHDGPLPRHAGLFATSWAILDGDKEHGVAWHVMTTEADTGDILKRRPVRVDPEATVHDLDLACFDAGIESFGELVDELAAGTASRTPQDLGLRTYHGKYDGLPRAGVFDWRQPAAELDAMVRATAFGRRRNDFGVPLVALDGDLLAVRAVEVLDQHSAAEPGTLLDAAEGALTVATGDRDIRLTDLAALTGRSLAPLEVAEILADRYAGRFPELTDDDVAKLTRAGGAAHREETRWLRVLDTLQPLLPPRLGVLRATSWQPGPVPLPPQLRGGSAAPPWPALAGALAFLARLTPSDEWDLALPAPAAGTGPLVVPEVPLRMPRGFLEQTLTEAAELVSAEVTALRARSPYRRDLPVRHPSLSEAARTPLPVAVLLPGDEESGTSHWLTVRVDDAGSVDFDGGTELTAGQKRWLGEHFAQFLGAAAAEPGRPLGELPLLTSEEREAVRGRWNDTAQEYPNQRTVSGLVADLACAAPEVPALRFEDQELTYGALDQAADALAHRLIELGAGRGSLVGVYLERSPELVVALLAVMKSGAAYVPIDPIYPQARLSHMIADSGISLVVSDAVLGPSLAAFQVTPVLVQDTARGSGEVPVPAPVDRSVPDAAAYVLYTSGSTGLPKGVQVGHRALVNFLWTMARTPGFSARDSMAALTTVCFDIAGLELYLPLVRGGTVEVLPAAVAADGLALREWIERSRPTVLQATPTTWQMLIAAGWAGAPGLRALCGGEPLPDELAARLTGLVGELHNMYGPTETTIWSLVDRVLPGEPVTIGRPVGNTRCHVLDERGIEVPPGVPGELYLSGDGVADGYLGRPELTAERFLPAPSGPGRAYRTGDLVRQLPDGRLEYLERIDGQIKLNGYRIELGEVESVLRRQAGVDSAVVVVREDQPGERRLTAYVTGSASLPQPTALRAALRDELPAYMVPAAVVVLPELPLTPNGKIDRKALPVPRPPRTAGAEAGVRTGMERRIAEVWCQVLGLDRVGAEDNFFDLGGDSLRLTSVTAILRERIDRPITRLDMFRHPTVRAMAAHLSDDAAPAIAPQRRGRDFAALEQRRGRRKRRS